MQIQDPAFASDSAFYAVWIRIRLSKTRLIQADPDPDLDLQQCYIQAGFYPSILRHKSWGAADDPVWNNVHKQEKSKNIFLNIQADLLIGLMMTLKK